MSVTRSIRLAKQPGIWRLFLLSPFAVRSGSVLRQLVPEVREAREVHVQSVLTSCTWELTFCWLVVLEAVTSFFECLIEIQTQSLTSKSYLIGRLRSSFFLAVKMKNLGDHLKKLQPKLPAFKLSLPCSSCIIWSIASGIFSKTTCFSVAEIPCPTGMR